MPFKVLTLDVIKAMGIIFPDHIHIMVLNLNSNARLPWAGSVTMRV